MTKKTKAKLKYVVLGAIPNGIYSRHHFYSRAQDRNWVMHGRYRKVVERAKTPRTMRKGYNCNYEHPLPF